MTVADLTVLLAVGIAAGVAWAGWARAEGAAEVAYEVGGWLALAGLTLWLYAPYLGGRLVGAGDAYHYSLQIADYVTQVRTGHFPVFVGQTEYGFNGNIHTLRTAPYFSHFAGLIDLLTGRRLGFAELLDLTILTHALGLAFSAWRVARWLLGRAERRYALGLAALYALSPAIGGTVQAFDLVATFMALPWLPVLLGSIVAIVEGETWPGTLLGTWSLGLIWWAHPALGLWSTLLWFLAWVVVLVRRRGPGRWAAFGLSAIGVAAMSAYCFVSVGSLHLGYNLGDAGEVRSDIVAAVQPMWPGFIFHRLGDPAKTLRPGYPLWLLGLLPVLIFRVRSDARRLLVLATFILLLLIGLVPLLTQPLWRLVPNPILQVTNTAIVSRSPAMFATLLLTLAALGHRALAARSRGQRRAAGCALALAVGWSAFAVGPIRRTAAVSAWTPADTASNLDPRNVYLTRSSYALFGRFPAYFTNGRTSAPWEVRLLADWDQRPRVANDAAVVAADEAAGTAPRWQALDAGPVSLPTRPDLGYVLEFRFSPGLPPGEVQIRGRSVFRNYTLPRSGNRAAFGAEPASHHLLGFMPDEHDGPALEVRATVAGVAVRAHPFAPAALPLRVESLQPLRVQVRAAEPSLLESPRVWAPGYRGTVDGREVPVLPSTEGLAMLAVSPGVHEVELRYVPPASLRAAYALSLLAFAGWSAGLTLCWRVRPEAFSAARRRHAKAIVGAGTALLVVVGLFAAVRAFQHRTVRDGALRLNLVLPRNISAPAEPLVVTGTTGAADVLFVHYLSNERLQIGFDEWGRGGPVSAPMAYRPGETVQLELAYATLYAGAPDEVPAPYRDSAHSAVIVRWNGQTILDFAARVQPPGGLRPKIGVNDIGASSCSPRFTGKILEASRLGQIDLAGK